MDFTEDNDTDDEISTIFPPKVNVLYLSQISLLRDIDLWKKKTELVMEWIARDWLWMRFIYPTLPITRYVSSPNSEAY